MEDDVFEESVAIKNGIHQDDDTEYESQYNRRHDVHQDDVNENESRYSRRHGVHQNDVNENEPRYSRRHGLNKDDNTENESSYNRRHEDDDSEFESQYNRRQVFNGRRERDFVETIKPKIRAKSARDLVKSQEHLVDLLQSMKSDISKMDREASRIKEDIVRSTQLFHVMVKMKKAHHLQRVTGGYNISHSLPREVYRRYKSASPELNIRYLDQLSSYRPTFLSGTFRRSSLSSASSQDSSRYQNLRYTSSLPNTARSSLISRNSSSSGDSYSGNSATESELDFTQSEQLSVAETARSFSQNSDTEDDAGSSTESASTQGPPDLELNRRRSSYFYTARRYSPAPVQSDEIDL